MFDHLGVAVSDLSVSERFYRTVLSVLGIEPSYAGPDMVGWDDWWIGQTDREHPVTHGLHVGFRAPDRAAVDAFWQVRPVPDGRIDHLWLRVRNPQASRRFYTTVAPHAKLRLAHDAPDRVQFFGPDFSFSLVRDERPLRSSLLFRGL